ncbi:MAG TPA: hypothetical protein VGE12_11760 [Noviherbaspirillum sp.]
MTLTERQLDLRIAGCALALSARRLWEHTEFGQVNPFAPIPATGAVRPEAYVDVVNMSGAVQMLTGLTLEEALAGRQSGVVRLLVKQLLRHVGGTTVRHWLSGVQMHLQDVAQKRAERDPAPAFLAPDGESPFGVQGLHSALRRWLHAHRADKAGIDQWRERIDCLTQEGLCADELAFCGVNDNLPDDPDLVMDGDAISDCVNFDALRFSILPAAPPTCARLEFTRVPANAELRRTKPKLRSGIQTYPQWRDCVHGYSIDIVEWADLLGPAHGWMAFNERGEPVSAENNPTGLCDSLEEAKRLVNRHAEKFSTEISAERESFDSNGDWIVTLPYYAPSYFCRHVAHRNVLMRMRTGMRETPDGECVLLILDLRSDWAEQARRDRKKTEASSTPTPVPPWLQEWPALAMKLLLLHAAQRGAQALAWTTGDMQASHDGGFDREARSELFDRILPAEANRLLRPYGKQCVHMEYYRPANFYIEPAAVGYEVRDQSGQRLGSAPTWEDAQHLLPGDVHEVLLPMHAVVLNTALKQIVLTDGFLAWG